MTEQGLSVTTITPVYNNAQYLDVCIRSLLSQTYENMQCIFVDDGSSDGSVDILKKYENEPRIRVIYKMVNGGIASAYRAAMHFAKGDIICLLDADDIALPHRVAQTVKHFSADENIGLVYSQVELIDSKGTLFPYPLRLPSYLTNTNWFMQLFRRGFFTGTAMAFRNKKWLKFDLDIICCDYYLSMQFAERGYNFSYIDQTLTQYRIHPHNTSNQARKMIDDVLVVQNKYNENVLQYAWQKQMHEKREISTTLGINQYYWKKDIVAAEKYYLQAIEQGGTTEAYFYMGVIRDMQGDLKQAYEFFEMAYSNLSSYFAITHNYGILVAKYKGDISHACELLGIAKQQQPYYLLIEKNEELLNNIELNLLKLIHFLSDEDAVFNSYYRMVQ
jgi:glycosyltransferase involved in cell wall biosynthesis